MKITLKDYSDLPPSIQNLLEPFTLPSSDIWEKIRGKKQLVEECVKLIEESSEVQYPHVFVKPYAYITPIEYEPIESKDSPILGYLKPVVYTAHTFTRKIDGHFEIAVSLSAATMLLSDKRELVGLLGHEFLHYAYRARLYLSFIHKEPIIIQKIRLDSRDISSYFTQRMRLDKLKLEDPNVWFDDYVIGCVEYMEVESKAASSLIKKIMKEWFGKNYPCLPLEVEDAIRKKSLTKFDPLKLRINQDILNKIKMVYDTGH